jgi:hypothetical protein
MSAVLQLARRLGCTVVLAAIGVAQAQDALGPFDLDEARAPASPAFTLLRVSPTDVERPSSSRAFVFSALSAAERSDGSFPTNLAMEFTPYWWSDRPDLTFDRFYNGGFAQRLVQSLSVSIASSELSTYRRDESAEGTALALGVRANLLGGKPAPALAAKVRQIKEMQLQFLEDCVDDLEEPGSTDAEPARAPSEECTEVSGQISSLAKEIASLHKERVGLLLDFAAGTVSEFADNTTDAKETSKYGAWLTWSYRSEQPDRTTPQAQSYLIFAAVQRWIRDEVAEEDALDVGARVIYKSRKDRWSVSGEYLKRFGAEEVESDATRLVFEYLISERYSLVAALGRDFDTPNESSPLVAIAGINVSLGRAPAGVIE